MQKQRRIAQRIYNRPERLGAFLSQAGPRVFLCLLQAGHHLC
jgi:hypothetical protein